MPARYHLTSDFRLSAPRDALWDRLIDLPGWPTWWRWSKSMDRLRPPSGEDGVGASYRHRVGSPLGYGFSYTGTLLRVDPGRLLEMRSTGDLEGTARFLMEEDGERGTCLSFVWLAQTPKWWMNAMAPLARPMFTWNHDKLMTDFGKGLAAVSGGRLLSVRNGSLNPRASGFHEMPPG